MPTLHAADALLPSGWAGDVLLEWDDAGVLTRVSPGHAAGSAPRAPGLVMAGMPNAHSHAFQRAMAGLAEMRGPTRDDFWTWREAMYRLVERLEPDDLEAVATHLYIEMLRHGYTGVAEFHYLHNDRDGRPYADAAETAHRIVAAAGAAGIALTLLPVLYAHGGFGHRPLTRAQRRFASDPPRLLEMLRGLADWHLPSPVLRFGLAPHSVRAVDALLLTELVEGASAFDAGMPLHMHISEQASEVAQCLETHATTPFEWIRQLVSVDSHWCLVHGTHLTAPEAGAAAASGACIALCPLTEASLGDGLFDFPPWFERRAPWAIGGDSHVSVSPFAELRALEYGQRLRTRARNIAADEAAPDVAANLWRAAAAGGAQALGQPAGTLEPGRRADLVALDGDCLDFESLTAAAMLGVALFSGEANRVRDVYVAGRRVVADGHHEHAHAASERYRATVRRLRGP